jgi:plastocyanin
MNNGRLREILIVFGLLWTILIGPVAFGNNSSPLMRVGEQASIQRFELHLESYDFSPSRLEVKVDLPIEITLINDSFLVPHNFVLETTEKKVYLERNVDAGEQAVIRFTLTQPGVYYFYCDKQLLFFPSHREEGMAGSIQAL